MWPSNKSKATLMAAKHKCLLCDKRINSNDSYPETFLCRTVHYFCMHVHRLGRKILKGKKYNDDRHSIRIITYILTNFPRPDCKGICIAKYHAVKRNPTMYYQGLKWCKTCYRALASKKRSCPCCGYRLREMPASSKGRKAMRLIIAKTDNSRR